jgi:hypothetical protein
LRLGNDWWTHGPTCSCPPDAFLGVVAKPLRFKIKGKRSLSRQRVVVALALTGRRAHFRIANHAVAIGPAPKFTPVTTASHGVESISSARAVKRRHVARVRPANDLEGAGVPRARARPRLHTTKPNPPQMPLHNAILWNPLVTTGYTPGHSRLP